MYKEILRAIDGHRHLPGRLAACCSSTVFTVVLVWACAMDRAGCARLAALPLDDGDAEPVRSREVRR